SLTVLAATLGMVSVSSLYTRSDGGMPVQLAGLMKKMPTPITNSTTPTLTPTSTALVVALSRMPMTRITVTIKVMSRAGRFSQAPLVEKGSLHRNGGIFQEKRT